METYNIINDINEYKTDICQILDDINKINSHLNDLNGLLSKRINYACKDLNYNTSLIVSDQLSNIIDLDYILRKSNIFYSYCVINDKYISYNYFILKNNIFSNTFNRSGVTSDYLKRDLETLDHILHCINDIIDTIK